MREIDWETVYERPYRTDHRMLSPMTPAFGEEEATFFRCKFILSINAGTKNSAMNKDTARLMITTAAKSCKFNRIFSSKKKMITRGAHSRQSGRQNRQERFPVMMVPDMIGHHDRIIDHQAERDRDTRQRVQLHLQP